MSPVLNDRNPFIKICWIGFTNQQQRNTRKTICHWFLCLTNVTHAKTTQKFFHQCQRKMKGTSGTLECVCCIVFMQFPSTAHCGVPIWFSMVLLRSPFTTKNWLFGATKNHKNLLQLGGIKLPHSWWLLTSCAHRDDLQWTKTTHSFLFLCNSLRLPTHARDPNRINRLTRMQSTNCLSTSYWCMLDLWTALRNQHTSQQRGRRNLPYLQICSLWLTGTTPNSCHCVATTSPVIVWRRSNFPCDCVATAKPPLSTQHSLGQQALNLVNQKVSMTSMPNRLSNHCISKIVLDIRNQQWAGIEVRDLNQKASALMTTKSHIIDKRSTTD